MVASSTDRVKFGKKLLNWVLNDSEVVLLFAFSSERFPDLS